MKELGRGVVTFARTRSGVLAILAVTIPAALNASGRPVSRGGGRLESLGQSGGRDHRGGGGPGLPPGLYRRRLPLRPLPGAAGLYVGARWPARWARSPWRWPPYARSLRRLHPGQHPGAGHRMGRGDRGDASNAWARPPRRAHGHRDGQPLQPAGHRHADDRGRGPAALWLDRHAAYRGRHRHGGGGGLFPAGLVLETDRRHGPRAPQPVPA